MTGLRSRYLIRPPRVYRWLFSDALFRQNPKEKTVYLTFDDGPHPEATQFVLKVLQQHGVKATFFMLGKNVWEHPELVERIRNSGHGVAGHGTRHLNGWVTPNAEYLADSREGSNITSSRLFRPPYGRLTLPQYRDLKKDLTIVFWDVISGDFDPQTDAQTVKNNVIDNVRNGSIIVMHDSKKALNNLRSSLDDIIKHLLGQGYRFSLLE